jgi:uncharacterized membrane protein YgaE (UPF0421/DUF939 family)
MGMAFRRLRGALFPIAQTSIASGLAWYLAHDVVGHRQPFFAPIAAAVCLSASNVLRTQRTVQLTIGVTFGIVLGAAVQALLGTGSIAIAVAVFVSLSGAVLIAHGYIARGLMFFNQITVSATLVIALSRSGHRSTSRRHPDRWWSGHRVRRSAVPRQPDHRAPLRPCRRAGRRA